jgi:leucyl aminopeptidase
MFLSILRSDENEGAFKLLFKLKISLISDFTNADLNSFFAELMDYYNASGDHEITYGTSLCNYGCSDHASWTAEGYKASFPFEASFGQHNGNIHSSNDTYSISGTAEHATKFAKLCAEFLIEVAKNDAVLAVNETMANQVFAVIINNSLQYDLTAATTSFSSMEVFDVLGKKVLQQKVTETKGEVSVVNLASGIYISKFTSNNGTSVSKKLLKK